MNFSIYILWYDSGNYKHYLQYKMISKLVVDKINKRTMLFPKRKEDSKQG